MPMEILKWIELYCAKLIITLLAFHPLIAGAIIVGGAGPSGLVPKPKIALWWPCAGLLSYQAGDAFGVYQIQAPQNPKMLRIIVNNDTAEDWQRYEDLDFSRYKGQTDLRMIIGPEFDLPPMGPEFDLPAKFSPQQRAVLSEVQNVGFISEKPPQLQALLREIGYKINKPGVATWIPHSCGWPLSYTGICYSAYLKGFVGIRLRSGEIIYEMYESYNTVEFHIWEHAFRKLLKRLDSLGHDNRTIARIISYQLHPAHKGHKFDAMTPDDISFASKAQKLFADNQIDAPFEQGIVSQTWDDIELLFYRTLPVVNLIERNKTHNNF